MPGDNDAIHGSASDELEDERAELRFQRGERSLLAIRAKGQAELHLPVREQVAFVHRRGEGDGEGIGPEKSERVRAGEETEYRDNHREAPSEGVGAERHHDLGVPGDEG